MEENHQSPLGITTRDTGYLVEHALQSEFKTQMPNATFQLFWTTGQELLNHPGDGIETFKGPTHVVDGDHNFRKRTQTPPTFITQFLLIWLLIHNIDWSLD